MAAYTPDDWLYMSPEQIDLLTSNSTFPFENVTKDQFIELAKGVGDRTVTNRFLRVAGTTISSLGIILTLLLLCSLWRKAVAQKNNFYRAMLLIALIDLLYNVFSLFHYSCYKILKLTGSPNYVWMTFLLVNKGLMFAMSLASDMCAVSLTLERYLAIARAQLHRTLTEKYTVPIRVFVTVLVILVSCTRLHYCMDIEVTRSGALYFFGASEFGSTPFVVGLTMVSDVILPIGLLVAMLMLSTLFRLAVRKRLLKQLQKRMFAARTLHAPGNSADATSNAAQATMVTRNSQIAPVETQHRLNRAADASANPAQDPVESASQDLRSIMILTLSLDSQFLLNQIGYCFYFAAEMLIQNYQIQYGSTYQEITTRVAIIRVEAYADLGSNLAELLSHTLNFVLYMSLSFSMRQEFRGFLRRIRCGR